MFTGANAPSSPPNNAPNHTLFGAAALARRSAFVTLFMPVPVGWL
jgi:hypothetical protein